MSALTYTGTLTVSTCWCGIRHAVPSELSEKQEREHRNGQTQTGIYCPLGHSYIFSGEGEADRLKRALQFERDHKAAVIADRDQAQASLRATRGVVTKLRKRAVAGACPFGCKRHFADLSRHVTTKHPDQTLEGES